MKTKNLGFTLVELIVVITILAILGTIGFISLEGYSTQARDAKRISDVSSLASKINLEQIRGVSLIDLIEIGSGHIASGSILGNINNNIITFGKINFDNLRETENNFKDPNGRDYLAAYAIGMGSGGLRYNFFELATINEKENKTKIVGNYYRLETEDIPSLFLSGGIRYENNDTNLIYSPNDNYIPPVIEEPEVTTIEIYGDEGEEEITICNKWVEKNVGELGGGAENWLWVPARHFTTDGYGIGMDDEYYKREITYNGINYICNGFAVAKYEMSYEEAISPNSTGGGDDWNTIKYAGTDSNGGIVSIVDRYPIADITQPQAISACRSIGLNIEDKGLDFHLITNNEWMAIARNIEQQASNWSNNEVGSGYISTGLSNSSMGCEGTSNILYGEERLYGAKSGFGGNEECDKKRQLVLSNGNKIWDLAGNAREHVNKSNQPKTTDYNIFASNSIRISNVCLGNGWYNFSGDNGRPECNYQNGYSYENIGPATAGLNTSNGIGRIYSSSTENNIFLRGGDASSTYAWGLYSLRIAFSYNDFTRGIGFHCTL